MTVGSLWSYGIVQQLLHHCMAYMGASQELPPWMVATNMMKLALGSSQNVQGTNPYNSATNRFVAPVNGMYIIKAQAGLLNYPYNALILLSLRVNTIEVASMSGGTLTHVLYLATTDYVELYAAHNYDNNEPVFFGVTKTHVTMTSL